MKKLSVLFVVVLVFALFGAVMADDVVTLKIGASPAPHAGILNAVADELLAKGIKLEVVEFTDYVLPNTALEDGSLDANYFQHIPYLNDFNASYAEKNPNWINLVSLLPVHFEPMGIYGGKTASLDELKDGATIAVPNDATNEARALLLLEAQGLITIKEGKGLEATAKDIDQNPKNIKLLELEAAQLPRALQDVDFAIINGNYAIDAGLKADEMLAQEGTDSEAAQLYANAIVIRGNDDREIWKTFVEAFQCDTVRNYIEENFAGAVIPMF